MLEVLRRGDDGADERSATKQGCADLLLATATAVFGRRMDTSGLAVSMSNPLETSFTEKETLAMQALADLILAIAAVITLFQLAAKYRLN
jgi:hypothetical protein